MLVYGIMTMAIVIYASLFKNINNSNKRKMGFLIFAFGLMILIAVLRSSTVGRDLDWHYASNYKIISQLSWSKLQQFSKQSGYEIGFVYFCKILSLLSTEVQWFIAVTSIIIYTSLARFIYKNSENIIMSTFLVVFSCTFYMFLSMIRQAIAISIILIGYDTLKKKIGNVRKYSIFLAYVIVATLFHQSAILAVVFIVFDKLKFKKQHIVFALFIVLGFYFFYNYAYLFSLIFMGNSERYMAHINSSIEGAGALDGISIINIILTFGAFILGYITVVWNKRKIHKKMIVSGNDKTDIIKMDHTYSVLLYLCLMAGVFRLLGTRMNILNRVTYYFLPFTFILYPTALKYGGKCKKIVELSIYILYGFYYIYMTVKLAKIYYGTVPYTFFWQ